MVGAKGLEEALVPPKIEYDEHGLAVPRSAVYLVFLTIFLDSIAATISTPALPYYAREFGASNAYIGYLFGIWSFNATFCAPFLGRVSDKIGRRSVLALSLFGAGLANLGQATANSYWVLFFWRGFSGMWASVSALSQVYLADVCEPGALKVYMSWLAAVPGVAMTFGPGVGGLLSVFGLNVPILVDGVISLVASVCVYIFLPESPVWQASRRHQEASKSNAGGSSSTVSTQTPVPRGVWVVGLSGLLYGEAFGTRVSMSVVTLNAKLGFSALQVGVVYMFLAVLSVAQTIWVIPRLSHRYGSWKVAIWGTVLMGVSYKFAFAWVPGLYLTLGFLGLAHIGNSFRQASSGPISAEFADATNRGSVFAQVQMMTNMGRLLGPLIAGNLAVIDPTTWPWTVACGCCLLSALLLELLLRSSASAKSSESDQPAKADTPCARTDSPDSVSAGDGISRVMRGDSSWSLDTRGRNESA